MSTPVRVPAYSSREARQILEALGDDQWDWRTLTGLESSTKLPKNLILHVLTSNEDLIESADSEEFGPLFRLRNHRTPIYRQILSLADRILDYLAFGKRSIV